MTRAGKDKTVARGGKAATIIGIALCVLLLPIIVVNLTLVFKRMANKNEVPSLFGLFPMIVLTDSMEGTFDAGDLIICKTAKASDVKEGDVICFYDPIGKNGTTVTHRVVKIETAKDGSILWTTKGDANNIEDISAVPEKNLVGVYKFRLRGLGSAAMFMQSTAGLVIFIAIPIILLIGYDLIRKRSAEKATAEDTAALKAELAALRAEKAAGENAASREDKPAQPDDESRGQDN